MVAEVYAVFEVRACLFACVVVCTCVAPLCRPCLMLECTPITERPKQHIGEVECVLWRATFVYGTPEKKLPASGSAVARTAAQPRARAGREVSAVHLMRGDFLRRSAGLFALCSSCVALTFWIRWPVV